MVMAKDKATKTSELKQSGPTPGDVILIAGVVGGGYLIYRLIKGEGGGGACTPGAAKCDGFNLYTCNSQGQWVLAESNSPECGYIPEMWFGDNVELGRKSFSAVVIDVGWRADNVELGRKSFSALIVPPQWVGNNVEMGRQPF